MHILKIHVWAEHLAKGGVLHNDAALLYVVQLLREPPTHCITEYQYNDQADLDATKLPASDKNDG